MQDMVSCDANLASEIARRMVAWPAAMRWLSRELGVTAPATDEESRIAAVLRRGLVPDRCGPEMPLAPARPVEPFEPVAVRPVGEGYDVQHVGFQGRDAARARDVFDAMQAAALSRGGVAPFTPRQVAAGRTYAALVERHSAVGVRGISIEAQVGAGGRGDGGYIDAVIREGRMIDAMRAAADREVVRLGRRSELRAMVVVDWVCLHGLSATDVLRRCGIVADGRRRSLLQDGLGRALDRMAGIGVQ